MLLTALSTNANTVAGLETGADDYVTKPFDFDELKARVDRLIVARKAIRAEIQYKFNSPDKKVKTAFQDKLDKAILANISDKNFNVEILAEMLFLERSSLYRKIKKELNISPIGYIRNIRMSFAKKLMVFHPQIFCSYSRRCTLSILLVEYSEQI
ncbi:hypothetical protein MNBD_GAMMA01-1911 [hydrothermal vent metagenome]|uniref:Uncharacterized protein n=1 Tax=hydrothermal vent metagenome TaxID=652676 RepID=A0A3B0UZI4_9ZZZZ